MIEETRPNILSLSQRLSWLEAIFTGTRSPRKVRMALASVREPSWRRDFSATTLRSALVEGLSPALFEVGVPEGNTALSESLRRFKTGFAASGFELRDLREWLLSSIQAEDLRWIRELPEQTFSELIQLVQSGDGLTDQNVSGIRRAIADAVLSLALDLESIVRPVGSGLVIRALDFQIISRRASAKDERLQMAAKNCFDGISDCRKRMDEEENRLSFFLTDKVMTLLGRIELLISILSLKDEAILAPMVRKLVIALAEGAVADRDFRASLRKKASRVAREMAERMGMVGEKYIVRSTKDYIAMLRRAGGAGLITAGTIVAKFALGSLGLGLLVGGAMTSLNYVGSFLLMQLLGFRLATKQPSLTASTLVNRLKTARLHSQKAVLEIADEVASIARSQVAAAVGNFAVVIPATMLFHFAYRWNQGANFLSPATAHHVLDSLDPFHTLTIPFAILTGALLWLSTLFASSVEGWAAKRGCSAGFSRTLFGISSCVALGVLLAVAPTAGTALGFPIDVRHFTLSTGSLALAVCSLGISSSFAHGFLASFVGILIIGVMNFGVSFVLSLTWSAVARGVRRAHLAQVFGTALRFKGFPSHFFLPIPVRPYERDAV